VRPPRAGLSLPNRLRPEVYDSEGEWLESGVVKVDWLARAIGQPNLSNVNLLDVGSDPAFVKALLDESVPIDRYTGVSFFCETVVWLQANFPDPRFEFHHLDAGNAWLNPAGKPLDSIESLPVGPGGFGLISASSVFDHLAPGDYATMLRLLRRHIEPSGRLAFSLVIIDAEHPAPLEEELRSKLRSDSAEVRARAEDSIAAAIERTMSANHDPRFVDWDPDEPLARAQYTEDYAVELVERNGWQVEAIDPPQHHGSHSMLCRPA
jgi:hypothetical protein